VRNVRGLVLVAALFLGLDLARAPSAAADESAPPASAAPAAAKPPAPTSPAPAESASPRPPAPAAPKGVVIVAIGDEAGPAARALAREAYADETLRPRLDDATARVLAGEAPPAAGPAKLVEIADLRKAAAGAGNDTVTRRLFASLGADLGAVLVVAVTLREGRPSARVLSVAKGAFEPVELQGSIEPQADGSARVKWSGVTGLLGGFLPRSGAAAPASPPPAGATVAPAPILLAPGPLAPKKDPAPSIWSSPWTWVGIGVVAAAGVVVFAASQSQGDPSTLRLQGRVSP
jgi:hypothetical protein